MTEKVKVDYSLTLPWREGYPETVMAYGGGRRVDRVTTGGGRYSKTTGSGPRAVGVGKFEVGETTALTPTARNSLNGLEQSYLDSDWGIFLSGDGDQIVRDVIRDNDSMDDYITVIHSNAINQAIISCTRIPKMLKHHVKYGIDMIIPDDILNRLTPGEVIPAETRMCHTKAHMDDGNLGTGREANSVFITTLSANEDTCRMLDTAVRDFSVATVEEFTIPVDNDHIPCDIHSKGDRTNGSYRGIPAVGDILENGVVMTIRGRTKDFYLAQRTHKSLAKTRHPFDVSYSCGRNAEVISVNVIKSSTSKPMTHYVPTIITQHLDSLASKAQARYRTILNLDKQYRLLHRDNYTRHPTWNIMVTEAIKHFYGPKLKEWFPNGYGKFKEVHGTLEDNIVTGYLVRIKVRNVISCALGRKYTDNTGAKYVVSEIVNKDRMFKDQWGRVTEMVTLPGANVNRSIWGRLHDQYMSDGKFHLLRNMREIYRSKGFEDAKEYYLGGVKVMSDKTNWKLSHLPKEALDIHVQYLLDKAPFIQMDDEVGDESCCLAGAERLRNSKYRPPMGKLTFTDYNGKVRQTVNTMRIGSIYISINEKDALEFNACNIPMRQVSGTIRKLTSTDKKTSQISLQSNRLCSEADFRMLFDSNPPEDAKVILRHGTSIASLTEMNKRILKGDMLPDMEIDTSDSRGMEIYKAENLCDGVRLTNIPRNVTWNRDKT